MPRRSILPLNASVVRRVLDHAAAGASATFVWSQPGSGRWYVAQITRDLFSPTGLELSWGGRNRPRSGRRFNAFAEPDELAQALRALHARRTAHRYVLFDPVDGLDAA